MMVFNSALLASGEDNSRTELFTTDFDTKSAIVRFLSCHQCDTYLLGGEA